MHIEIRITIRKNKQTKKGEPPFTKEKGLKYSQYQLTEE